MAAPIRTTADRAEDAGRYQPLSLLAILALVVAGLYTVVVLVLTAVGLYTRKPVLELWLVLFAGLGVLAAIAARWQIHNAEGTLAGRGMASTALGLSIIFGCVYLAYYWGNVAAIRNQAREFVQDVWLKAMSEKKFDEAFLYTIEPVQRKGMTPRDAALRLGDQSVGFRQIDIADIFNKANGEVGVESLGVRDLTQYFGGFMVAMQFLIKTRTGEYEVLITATGTESKDLPGREWYVRPAPQYVQAKRMTTYGRMLTEAQMDGDRFLGEWVMGKLHQSARPEMFLDSLPLSREERAQKFRNYLARGLVGNLGLTAGAMPAGGPGNSAAVAVQILDSTVIRRVFLPEAEAAARNLVVFDTSKQDLPAAVKDELRPKLLRPGTMNIAMGTANSEIPSQMEILKDQVRVIRPIEFVLPAPVNYRSKGSVVAVCTDKELVAKLNELKNVAWSPTAPFDGDTNRFIPQPNKYDWHIAEVRVDLARARDDPRPGGATPMSTPPR